VLDCEKVFDQGQREPETEECFNVILTHSCLRAFVESFPGNLFQPRLKCRFPTLPILVTANEHSYGFKVSGQASTLMQRKVLQRQTPGM